MQMLPTGYILQYYTILCVMLVCGDLCFPFPHAGVLISTTASLVALWGAIVTVFGVVTAVLSWQKFKLKQKGMLGHTNGIEMNVSKCSCQVLVLPFSFSLPTKEPFPLLPSPSSSSQRL